MADSAPTTLAHIEMVRENMRFFGHLLDIRARWHDHSKFHPTEKGPLDELQRLVDVDGPAAYGSDEYKRRGALLAPMLKHHYEQNDHHAEHFGEAGIAGMTLMSLVEMFCDWRAANVERDGGEPMNLTYSIEKWKIEPMLASILRNTAQALKWEVK